MRTERTDPAQERALAANVAIGRIVDAPEVAWLVAFLASPLSVAINGDAVAAGGGPLGTNPLLRPNSQRHVPCRCNCTDMAEQNRESTRALIAGRASLPGRLGRGPARRAAKGSHPAFARRGALSLVAQAAARCVPPSEV